MGLITRPTKTGGSGSYVAGNDILASEANADADTVYAAVNGQLDTNNVKTTGAGIKGTQLATAPDGISVGNINDAAVETAKIKDLNVTAAKLAVGLIKSKVLTQSMSFNIAGTASEVNLSLMATRVTNGANHRVKLKAIKQNIVGQGISIAAAINLDPAVAIPTADYTILGIYIENITGQDLTNTNYTGNVIIVYIANAS